MSVCCAIKVPHFSVTLDRLSLTPAAVVRFSFCIKALRTDRLRAVLLTRQLRGGAVLPGRGVDVQLPVVRGSRHAGRLLGPDGGEPPVRGAHPRPPRAGQGCAPPVRRGHRLLHRPAALLRRAARVRGGVRGGGAPPGASGGGHGRRGDCAVQLRAQERGGAAVGSGFHGRARRCARRRARADTPTPAPTPTLKMLVPLFASWLPNGHRIFLVEVLLPSESSTSKGTLEKPGGA